VTKDVGVEDVVLCKGKGRRSVNNYGLRREEEKLLARGEELL
jgi:hypothetical protein